ncbi:molybdenum cofactor guanylyltransferase [Hydrogenivirga caldilitoris]|uniref:Probable molybdenum cofactor guanylyltransferase n=1 Tax=Hydrogenivirga caldilitoris TaxID=246264 RepID=A0A497XS16_9AQUI|nr:molybdenum cofactor guanylyltransferase MobA [Hydrogenivirga caldilitoris]RLJ71074.1 molybdenum cofactor guanylyltransferase [Hydrogenivirga caldilitoris]
MECFILAGGQSRRFGEDKILYKLGSKRTIDYIIEEAQKVCDKVFIVAKDREKFKDLHIPVLEDLLPFQAPIVGVYTALKSSGSKEVLILTGDMPLVKKEVLKLLMDSYSSPVTLFSINGKLYPLTAIYSTEILKALEEYIALGKRSLVGFLENVPCKVITEESVKPVDPELASFINMNTREDLSLLLEKIR